MTTTTEQAARQWVREAIDADDYGTFSPAMIAQRQAEVIRFLGNANRYDDVAVLRALYRRAGEAAGIMAHLAR